MFFAIFWLSERIHPGHGAAVQHLEKFNVRCTPELEPRAIRVRQGCKLVPVRDPRNLRHLDRALHEAEREHVDVVVPTVKVERELVATGNNPNFAPDEQVAKSSSAISGGLEPDVQAEAFAIPGERSSPMPSAT